MGYTESAILEIQQSEASEPDSGNTVRHDQLSGMLQEMAEGLLYCHHRDNANTSRSLEIGAFLYALVELITERGLISMEEIEERKKAVGERLARRFLEKGMGVVIQESEEEDKYAFNSDVRISCENRLHLCNAACCKMHFALSRQDLAEGFVRWNLGSPYVIAQRQDGYCTHLDNRNCQCTVYQNRPLPCRAYDCREDKRVWLDFEEKVINPDLDKQFMQPTEREPSEVANSTPL